MPNVIAIANESGVRETVKRVNVKVFTRYHANSVACHAFTNAFGGRRCRHGNARPERQKTRRGTLNRMVRIEITAAAMSQSQLEQVTVNERGAVRRGMFTSTVHECTTAPVTYRTVRRPRHTSYCQQQCRNVRGRMWSFKYANRARHATVDGWYWRPVIRSGRAARRNNNQQLRRSS